MKREVPDSPPLTDEYSLQSQVCDGMFIIGSVLSVPALIVALFRIIEFGWLPAMSIYLFTILVLWVFTFFRRSIPYRIRAGTLLVLVFISYLSNLWEMGLVEQGIALLMFVPVLSVALLGLKFGVISLILSVAGFSLIGAVTILTHRLPALGFETYFTSKSAWLYAGSNSVIVGATTMFVVGILMQQNAKIISNLRKRTDELAASEERLTYAFRGANDGLWDLSLVSGEVYCSPRWFEMLGYGQNELPHTQETFFSLLHPDDHDHAAPNQLVLGNNSDEILESEFRMRHKNGSWVNIHSRAFVVRHNGEPVRIVGTHIDITARKRAEAKLRAEEERLLESIEALPIGFAIYDADRKLEIFNKNYGKLLPKSAHLLEKGMTLEDLIRNSADVSAQLQGYNTSEEYVAERIKDPGKTGRIWEYRQSTGRNISSYECATKGGGFISIIEDTTDLEKNEALLKSGEHRLRQALRVAGLASWEVTSEGELIWSQEVFKLFNLDPDEFNGQTEYFYSFVHPDDRDRVKAEFAAATQEGKIYHCIHRVVLTDGTVKIVRESAEPLWDEHNKATRMAGIVQDITELTMLETKLHQAQKMEALGQLTGGIAHDFNNLLAVILGNAELLDDLEGDQSELASAIIRASIRGAELTQRLLAFSRQQPLKPKDFDLGELVLGMTELLKRTLGEKVEVLVNIEVDLGRALADPGLVENALLNLAINARDAMPGGGELTIECSNVTLEESSIAKDSDLVAGDYIVLSVTDHGEGMPEEVRKQAFEPFFTTKEIGHGSGLGLSMVFGFAQQSGGQVTIHSKEGVGTTVKLYLPRAQSETFSQTTIQPEAVPHGLGETILVIEDNPQVRDLTEVMLKNLGYKVICAEDVSVARRAVEGYSEIDLILSDVVLSGNTSGPDFAKELHSSHPDMKIIFMSGYPAEAAKHRSYIGFDRVQLNKPFTVAQLAKAVKEAVA